MTNNLKICISIILLFQHHSYFVIGPDHLQMGRVVLIKNGPKALMILLAVAPRPLPTLINDPKSLRFQHLDHWTSPLTNKPSIEVSLELIVLAIYL